jgi:peptidoglycan hydrolase-like protein with peptidoglycan-binding domain
MAPFRAVLTTSLVSLCVALPALGYSQEADGPANARKDACYIKYQAPALIETVTEQILVRPEKRGFDIETGQPIIIEAAIYRTETVQKIVRARQEDWIETVCAKDQTFEFLENLQRALTARGHYYGAITGIMDERTKRSIRKVQKTYDVNSSDLTLDLAESYGLVIHRIFE